MKKIATTFFEFMIKYLRYLLQRCHQWELACKKKNYDSGVQHLLHLKSKSKILRPIEIMGFFYEIFCQIQENNSL